MKKIAVVGDRDQILAFTALGLEIYPVTDEAHAAQQVEDLAKQGYAVILVQERFFEALSDLLAKYSAEVTPCITAIPGSTGSRGLALNALREIVKRAVGADIFAQGGLAQ